MQRYDFHFDDGHGFGARYENDEAAIDDISEYKINRGLVRVERIDAERDPSSAPHSKKNRQTTDSEVIWSRD